jgi:hypothetical protein
MDGDWSEKLQPICDNFQRNALFIGTLSFDLVYSQYYGWVNEHRTRPTKPGRLMMTADGSSKIYRSLMYADYIQHVT